MERSDIRDDGKSESGDVYPVISGNDNGKISCFTHFPSICQPQGYF